MSLITEKNNINSEEHILVCLSAAPSNKKIIDTATKMAEVLHARFTALYVQTGTKAEAMDKERLEEHIRYAEKLGAEIVMTHGGKHTGTDCRVCQAVQCYQNRDRTKQCQTKSLFRQDDSDRKAD